ncbi:hypothetical protein BHF71_00945 [Vulcanibacillus modesticaldus]|uniref:Uncharacterized protein n=1 Tax=Vulcanibacillus modesticaldus TaxID=337097 RepID=A0A1D2YVN7_9BACI|nr:DUF5693 family protein [Vulcanibacillus modesticaldus]OEF99774.1 hypothetical protein BHF71_00945 [Vulcanibacillus modesticaldus]
MEKLLNKALIVVVIIGFIASILLINERITWEKTANQVELVMDYDDIFILANNSENPEQVEDGILSEINGDVKSIAIYETTLERLKLRGEYTGDVWVYSGKELLSPLNTIQFDFDINPYHTYILFKNKELENVWTPLIKQFLAKEGEVTEFTWNGFNGLELAVPYRQVKQLSLGIDPTLVEKVKSYGFNVVPRISNSYSDKERTLALIEQVVQFKPTYIIFQGEEVTGFPSYLNDVAKILNLNQVGLGNVELIKEQAGIKSLAFDLAWSNISRVHSLSEGTMKLVNNPMDLQEQVELAVTERNIRLIYIHAVMTYSNHVPLQSFDYITLKESPEKIIDKTVFVIENIANRLQQEGFTLGKASGFSYQEKSWMGTARWLTLIAGIAIISVMVAIFFSFMKWPVFILGMLGIVIAKVLGLESLYFKFVALATAVAVPVIAIYYSLQQSKVYNKKVSFIHILKVYLITSLISFFGAWIVAAMFSHVKYSLYLDQFRGVSVLYLAPLLLTLILVMWSFNEPLITWLKGNFKNYYLLILGILGGMILYYLARSGNSATVSSLELSFRKMLQTYLDIRPRTKEFLIGYPLLLFGLYLSYYYKRAAYLLVAAAMGQLSIVSTFTHLHTPFVVSVIRTFLGLGLGLVVGIILIIGWNIIKPLWIKLVSEVNSL